MVHCSNTSKTLCISGGLSSGLKQTKQVYLVYARARGRGDDHEGGAFFAVLGGFLFLD
jgi:hypothetical protein